MQNVITIADALTAFAKADAKAHDAGTSYMALAVADVWNASPAEREAIAANLIADMCRVTGSVGKVTKEFPNGKPNPQALKANGYSGLAEGARLLRKIAKPDNADKVANVVDGFLGVIQSETLFEDGKNADKRIIKALESGEDAKLAKAEAAYLADYLALTYPDRPTSFSALRRALDKATTATGTADAADGDSDGDSGDGDLEQIGATDSRPLTDEEVATLFASRLAAAGDSGRVAIVNALGDDAIQTLIAAIQLAANVLAEADEQREAA